MDSKLNLLPNLPPNKVVLNNECTQKWLKRCIVILGIIDYLQSFMYVFKWVKDPIFGTFDQGVIQPFLYGIFCWSFVFSGMTLIINHWIGKKELYRGYLYVGVSIGSFHK